MVKRACRGNLLVVAAVGTADELQVLRYCSLGGLLVVVGGNDLGREGR